MVERFGPVQEILGPGDAHLAAQSFGVGEKVHPILAVDFPIEDGAAFGPADIPFAFISRQDDAFAIPVNQVGGGSEAKLSVLFVVAGIGEIVEAADFDEAGIFDAAILFIRGFGRKDGFRTAGEVDSVGAGGVAEA